MARRRISVDRINEVIRHGVTTDLSERAIGRALKVSRTAVAKYLGSVPFSWTGDR